MVLIGQWRATATPAIPGCASFDTGGLLATFSNVIEEFTAKFLAVKENLADLQDFINSDLGEVWEEPPKKQMHRAAIWRLRDALKYERGVVPCKPPCKVTLIADVQEFFIPWAVWAVTPRESS